MRVKATKDICELRNMINVGYLVTRQAIERGASLLALPGARSLSNSKGKLHTKIVWRRSEFRSAPNDFTICAKRFSVWRRLIHERQAFEYQIYKE